MFNISKIVVIALFFYSQNCQAQIKLLMTGEEIKTILTNKAIYKNVEYENFGSNSFSATFIKKDDSALQNMCAIRNDSCIAITRVMSYDKLNSVMTFCNNKYVKITEYSWIDYGEVNVYWNISRQHDFFAIIATIDNE
jgi:hypothetical protein